MPDAEVSLHLVNVGFGGVIYRGVTVLEASYIERGADTQLTQGKDRDFGILFRQVMAVTLEKRVAAFKD